MAFSASACCCGLSHRAEPLLQLGGLFLGGQQSIELGLHGGPAGRFEVMGQGIEPLGRVFGARAACAARPAPMAAIFRASTLRPPRAGWPGRPGRWSLASSGCSSAAPSSVA